MLIKRAARGLIPLVALWLLAACAGPSASVRKNLDLLIAEHQYDKAESLIDRNKLTEYGKKNMVLYYLDRGGVLHDAGKYKESDESLETAESRIDELYTKSITKTGGMLLLNDNTVDYAGEPFEHALLNVYRALDYVFLGNEEEALVESRKVEQFLDGLNRSIGKKNLYKDDAFARYLDSLLYADLGEDDDARISRDAANAAYKWYSSDYDTPAPRFPVDDDPAAGGAGELVFIHDNGVAPRKISKTFQVAWGNALAIAQEDREEGGQEQFRNALRAGVAGNAITISYPEYVQDRYRIRRSEVLVDGQLAGDTVLMEDISAIAFKSLRDRMDVIRARAIARATVKYVIAKAAADAAGRQCDERLGSGTFADQACRALSRGVTSATAAATEIADTRAWASLPSQIRMARVKVPAGVHDVTVNFLDAAGDVVDTTEFKGVTIQPGKRTYLHYRTAS